MPQRVRIGKFIIFLKCNTSLIKTGWWRHSTCITEQLSPLGKKVMYTNT